MISGSCQGGDDAASRHFHGGPFGVFDVIVAGTQVGRDLS